MNVKPSLNDNGEYCYPIYCQINFNRKNTKTAFEIHGKKFSNYRNGMLHPKRTTLPLSLTKNYCCDRPVRPGYYQLVYSGFQSFCWRRKAFADCR